MKVTNVEKKENSTVELTIHVEADEFEAAVQKAYLKSRSLNDLPEGISHLVDALCSKCALVVIFQIEEYRELDLPSVQS